MQPLLTFAPLFYWGPVCVAFLTVFYMTRSFALTFLGKPRDQHLFDHAHEAPAPMLIPQIVLAIMALVTVPKGLPFLDLINSAAPNVAYVQPGDYHKIEHAMHFTHGALLHGFAWILMIAAGIAIYIGGMGISSKIASLPLVRSVHQLFLNKFYFDGLYDIFAVNTAKAVAYVCAFVDKWIVDGIVNLVASMFAELAFITGRFDKAVVDGAVDGAATAATSAADILRSTQSGRVRLYVLVMFTTATVISLAVMIIALVVR